MSRQPPSHFLLSDLIFVQGKGRTLPLAKRPTSPGDSGGPNDWKALAPTTLDSVPIGMLRWGAAGGVLGVFSRGMADGAHVLAETVLHRHIRCYEEE